MRDHYHADRLLGTYIHYTFSIVPESLYEVIIFREEID